MGTSDQTCVCSTSAEQQISIKQTDQMCADGCRSANSYLYEGRNDPATYKKGGVGEKGVDYLKLTDLEKRHLEDILFNEGRSDSGFCTISQRVSTLSSAVARYMGLTLLPNFCDSPTSPEVSNVFVDPESGFVAYINNTLGENGEVSAIYLTFRGVRTKPETVRWGFWGSLLIAKQYIAAAHNIFNGVIAGTKLAGMACVPQIYLRAAEMVSIIAERMRRESMDAKLYLTGHSLGAGIVEYAMSQNSSVVTSATIFQPLHLRGITAAVLCNEIEAQEKIYCIEVAKENDLTINAVRALSSDPFFSQMNYIECVGHPCNRRKLNSHNYYASSLRNHYAELCGNGASKCRLHREHGASVRAVLPQDPP